MAQNMFFAFANFLAAAASYSFIGRYYYGRTNQCSNQQVRMHSGSSTASHG
jgi:hypothetical protein